MKLNRNSSLHITIITGLAGSGKTTALNAFEDKGFYCVDNLPFFLLRDLIEQAQDGQLGHRLALVMDSRDPTFAPSIQEISEFRQKISMEIIFLEAQEEILIRRFSQHRRPHPLAAAGTLQENICQEKKQMHPVKQKATTVIDTSRLTPHELRHRLHLTCDVHHNKKFKINLLSFGFKHGVPQESDLVWDVRFLPNPYYVDDLRPLSGKEPAVASYALDNDSGTQFFIRLEPLLDFLIAGYQKEGKMQLTISIGCTGGRHRSVAVTDRLHTFLSQHPIKVAVFHRDIDRAS